MTEAKTESEIRRMLVQYRAGKSSLTEIQEMLAPIVMGDSEVERQAHELAFEVFHQIAEYTSGHLTKEELRDALYDSARSGQRHAIPQE